MEVNDKIYIKIVNKLCKNIIKDSSINGYERELNSYLLMYIDNSLDKEQIKNLNTKEEYVEFYMNNIYYNVELYRKGLSYIKKLELDKEINKNKLLNENIEDINKNIIFKILKEIKNEEIVSKKIIRINKLIMLYNERNEDLKYEIETIKINNEINSLVLKSKNKETFIINPYLIININTGKIYYINKKEMKSLLLNRIVKNQNNNENKMIEKLIIEIIKNNKKVEKTINNKVNIKDQKRIYRLKDLVYSKADYIKSKGLKFDFSLDNKSVKISTNNGSEYLLTTNYIKDIENDKVLLTRDNATSILKFIILIKNIKKLKFNKEELEILTKLLLAAWDLRKNIVSKN